MYPPNGYRSFGPIRGLIYGGADYADHANEEMIKISNDRDKRIFRKP